MTCPLCAHPNPVDYWQDKRRRYLQCEQCALVFVDPNDRLDSRAEKEIYDLHQNDVDDLGYQAFLSRLSEPLLAKLKHMSDKKANAEQPNAAKKGLDFGCGPGPALAKMLQDAGHHVALYDLYYYPDKSVLETKYDFIVATEVIEHLYEPEAVWQLWLSLLKPKAYLGLMTKLVKDRDAFSRWHYKNDLTHVIFFSRETFEYLARRDQLELEFIGSDVILLRKD